MENISSWFWNERFWFPEGITFEDVKSTPYETYPQPRDLFALPIYGFAVFILRHLFEHYASNPFARLLLRAEFKALENGVVKNHYSAANGNGYHKSGHHNSLKATESYYSKKKAKRLKKINSTMAKIAETNWKIIYHSFAFTFGMSILSQTAWFWDTRHCWIDYPKHSLWPSLYYYYMLEGAYYIALLLCLTTDVKRKDRNMMIVHHVGTINLIVFSYATNQIRIGSLLMVLHRFADMLLQITKLFSYCKWKKVANVLFVIFVLSFLVTRLYIYPFYVLHTSMIKPTWYLKCKTYPWFFVANFINIVLLILHILWAYIILKMAVKVVIKGPIERDDRSGTEEEDSDEEDDASAEKKR